MRTYRRWLAGLAVAALLLSPLPQADAGLRAVVPLDIASTPEFSTLGLGGAAPGGAGALKLYGGTSGGISISDNANNQIALTANSGFKVSGTGSYALGSAFVGTDGTDNNVVINGSLSGTDTTFVVNPSPSAGAYIVVNADAGTSTQEQLIIGSQGNAATRYEFAQAIVGTGACLPVDFMNASSQVAFRLTCDPYFRLPNAKGIYARNAADSADLKLLELDSSNFLQLGGGVANGIRWTLASTTTGQVQVGESGGNGVVNLNGQGVSSSAYNLLSSSGNLFVNRGTGKTISFRENNGVDQFVIRPGGHLSAGTTAPTLTSCGTSPAIVGTDIAGRVTMGTGSPTGCVITFATAYTLAPICTVTWRATPLASQSYAISNTAITLTQTATSSNIVDYHCIAQPGG